MAAPSITRIGVIGAGQMGSGIAQVCALAGYAVTLYDIAPAQLEAARASIAAGIKRGDLSESEGAEALARVVPRLVARELRRLRPGDRGGERGRGGEA